MDVTQIKEFNLVGIFVRTNDGDLMKLMSDMQGLWNKFLSENIAAQITNKINNDIYCVYTDYEGDYTKPYVAFLGCQVANLDDIPDGLIGRKFSGGKFNKYVAKGNIMHGIVAQTWGYIWNLDLSRTYIADFEVYGARAEDLANAEVDIFIGVK